MVDHMWTVVCSQAVIDNKTNNVSLHNVVEQFNIPGPPVPGGILPIQLDIVTAWVRSRFDTPAQGRARLTILSPTAVLGTPFEYDVDLSEKRRNRTVFTMQGLPIDQEGRYAFRVELRNEGETAFQQVAEVPVEVNFTPTQPQLIVQPAT